MNELEIEKELRKLRPAAPSRELEGRIADELAECRQIAVPRHDQRRRGEAASLPWITLWFDRLLWSGLGAAVSLAVLMSLQKPRVNEERHAVARDASTTDAAMLQPVLASEEDLGWRDEGVQFDAHGQPMLKLRRVAVERRAWADLQNAGVIQMETPRQEVMWVPVTLH